MLDTSVSIFAFCWLSLGESCSLHEVPFDGSLMPEFVLSLHVEAVLDAHGVLDSLSDFFLLRFDRPLHFVYLRVQFDESAGEFSVVGLAADDGVDDLMVDIFVAVFLHSSEALVDCFHGIDVGVHELRFLDVDACLSVDQVLHQESGLLLVWLHCVQKEVFILLRLCDAIGDRAGVVRFFETVFELVVQFSPLHGFIVHSRVVDSLTHNQEHGSCITSEYCV